MVLIQRGDVSALDALYQRYQRLAMTLAFRVVGSRESAEDVLQEAFISIWRRAESYHPDRGRARDWLLRIVRNRAIDRIRRAGGTARTDELDEATVDKRSPEVWELADQAVQRDQVVDALRALPMEQRTVVELAYYGGLSHQDIATQIGVPLGTVKGRMRLAMEKLRTALLHLAPDEGARS